MFNKMFYTIKENRVKGKSTSDEKKKLERVRSNQAAAAQYHATMGVNR